MKIKVSVIRKNEGAAKRRVDDIIAQGQQIVLSQVLGGATAVYQIYPVGPESAHRDGSPHTRDTFAVALGDEIIATEGNFWTTTALGATTDGRFTVRFLARGAAFFLEWGTIFMEPQPLLRPFIQSTRANISNALRSLNK